MQIKITIFLAIIGLLTSILCGVIVDNRLPHVFMVAGISAIVMAVLGLVISSVLEKNVPEFMEAFSGFGSAGGYEDYEDTNSVAGNDLGATIEGENFSDKASSDVDDSTAVTPKADGNYGDHIVVDNIPIKNEPKLMAEAVRTMMANDDEG